MENNNLKDLIEFMNENNLCEIEIRENGEIIKLSRDSLKTPERTKKESAIITEHNRERINKEITQGFPFYNRKICLN